MAKMSLVSVQLPPRIMAIYKTRKRSDLYFLSGKKPITDEKTILMIKALGWDSETWFLFPALLQALCVTLAKPLTLHLGSQAVKQKMRALSN